MRLRVATSITRGTSRLRPARPERSRRARPSGARRCRLPPLWLCMWDVRVPRLGLIRKSSRQRLPRGRASATRRMRSPEFQSCSGFLPFPVFFPPRVRCALSVRSSWRRLTQYSYDLLQRKCLAPSFPRERLSEWTAQLPDETLPAVASQYQDSPRSHR